MANGWSERNECWVVAVCVLRMSDTLQLESRLKKVLVIDVAPKISGALSRAIQVESLSRSIPIILASKPDKYAAIKKLHDQVRDSAAKIYQATLSKLLAQAEAEVLRKLRSKRAEVNARAIKAGDMSLSTLLLVKAEESSPTTPLNVNFDLDTFTKRFMVAMKQAAVEAYEVCALGLIDEQDEDLKIRVTDNGIIQKFAYARANKIKDCPQNIFNQIQNALAEADKSGSTMPEMAEAVQGEFGVISEGRAYVIARQESLSAYSECQLNVLTEQGYSTKTWVTSDDELVRPSHVLCGEDGPVDIDGEFSNGLRCPGDAESDDAAEVMNCRCY